MDPQPIKGSLPKDNTPVSSVVPGGQPVAAANTKSLVFKSDSGSGKAQETQPLVVPEGLQWSAPVQAKAKEASAPTGRKAVVTMVLDGDTASLKADGKKGQPSQDIMCRLDKIDAPEVAKRGNPGQAYGEESKMNLKRLIEQKEVSVQVSTAKDQYGRSLCQIEIDGVDVSLKQLQDGAAWLYRQYGNPAEYNQAQAESRIQRKGLFADNDAVHPRQFKH